MQTEFSSLPELRSQSSALEEAKATKIYRTEYRRGGSYTKSRSSRSAVESPDISAIYEKITKVRKRTTGKE